MTLATFVHGAEPIMAPNHAGNLPVVLVVEDECDTRGLLTALLRAQVGCDVQAMSNGEDALAFLRASETPLPRVIVLDWMMPRMNGATMLAALKNDPVLASIPVVIWSGAAVLEAAHNAISVVEKPYGLTSLIAIVRDQCSPLAEASRRPARL